MMESLVHELTKVGLQLSSAKTKIFTTQALTKPLFVEVGGRKWWKYSCVIRRTSIWDDASAVH